MTRGFLLEGDSASARALEGVVLDSGGSIGLCADPVYVYAQARSADRAVALVSGGGSGHEPMHASFVGAGGLDAACPGELFTSPHNRQVYSAGTRVARSGGVLHIVKNYTGDRINFAIAAERLRADGHQVAEVVIDDDIGSAASGAGRRGTGATVVVEKILGAAADTGMSLADLADLGQRVANRSRSIAVAGRAHTNLSEGSLAFEIPDGELEFGVGIHGEAGTERITRPTLETLVTTMVDGLVEELPSTSDDYVLLVNGLGGTSNLELLHVLSAAHSRLAPTGRVRSACVGTYVSALDMQGFSITVTAAEEEWLPHWFATHQTPGLPIPTPLEAVDPAPATSAPSSAAPARSPWLNQLAETFQELERPLNRLDQLTGDGDFGTNMRSGFTRSAARATAADPALADDLAVLANAFLDDVGGSSGPLFGLFFQHTAQTITSDAVDHLPSRLTDGLRNGYAAVARVGGAEVGDRTLLDALHPALAHGGMELSEAGVQAAIDGARRTAELTGRRGRASYLGDRVLGTPDPGAVAAALILIALRERVNGEPADVLRRSALEILAT